MSDKDKDKEKKRVRKKDFKNMDSGTMVDNTHRAQTRRKESFAPIPQTFEGRIQIDSTQAGTPQRVLIGQSRKESIYGKALYLCGAHCLN